MWSKEQKNWKPKQDTVDGLSEDEEKELLNLACGTE